MYPSGPSLERRGCLYLTHHSNRKDHPTFSAMKIHFPYFVFAAACIAQLQWRCPFVIWNCRPTIRTWKFCGVRPFQFRHCFRNICPHRAVTVGFSLLLGAGLCYDWWGVLNELLLVNAGVSTEGWKEDAGEIGVRKGGDCEHGCISGCAS